MHIELIDTLRCPEPHEDSWLVGAFDRIIDRDIVEGRLGCPVCGRTYEVTGGVVYFDRERRDDAPPRPDALPAVGAEDALRLAAMLDLASPGGIVVLEGAWALAGAMLATFIDARLLALNPPAGVPERTRISGIGSTTTVPVASGSCRAIAIHRGPHAEPLARAAAPALRAGGRLVAPATLPLPRDVREVARDAQWWVAERTSPPALVTLGRR